MTRHLLVQLPLTPSGVPKRNDPSRGSPSFGDGAQNVDGAGHREKLALVAVHVERVLTSPIGRMEDKASARLDRAAMVNRTVGCLPRIDIELAKRARGT